MWYDTVNGGIVLPNLYNTGAFEYDDKRNTRRTVTETAQGKEYDTGRSCGAAERFPAGGFQMGVRDFP